MFDVILDCYTDEPSGLGAPPYLSVHSRYISGTLLMLGREHFYLTIDDIRISKGESHSINNTPALNKRIINATNNCCDTDKILKDAANIYVVYGCFVKYNYVSCEPPSMDELESVLAKYKEKAVLFYCLGTQNIPNSLSQYLLSKFKKVYYGNTYNYFIDFEHPFASNYYDLAKIAFLSAKILTQIKRPIVIELESMSGCNHKPGCVFCIESKRNNPLLFRSETDILQEVIALYSYGAKYFRIGRQPNFYAYGLKRDIAGLLSSIRSACPKLKMLHIDNVNPMDVVKDKDALITKAIVKYCTSGNIAPFGIESFDENVRNCCNLNGSIDDILNATQILNSFGGNRTGELPQFLPGYNLIYGLDGQNENTLQKNLTYLSMILNNKLLVRRTFVRRLESPFGVSFQNEVSSEKEYQYWCSQIEQSFSMPMLKKMYPIDMLLRNVRVEMVSEAGSILRMFGTCAERILIPNKFLKLDTIVDIKISGYINHRILQGKLL